jgi:hypothetical protein
MEIVALQGNDPFHFAWLLRPFLPRHSQLHKPAPLWRRCQRNHLWAHLSVGTQLSLL